jgi:hypothetical protein
MDDREVNEGPFLWPEAVVQRPARNNSGGAAVHHRYSSGWSTPRDDIPWKVMDGTECRDLESDHPFAVVVSTPQGEELEGNWTLFCQSEAVRWKVRAFPRRLHASWLPVIVSLALHGLFGLYLGWLAWSSPAGEPLGRVVRDTRISLALSDPASPHDGPDESLVPSPPVVAAPPDDPPARYAPTVPAFSQRLQDGVVGQDANPAARPAGSESCPTAPAPSETGPPGGAARDGPSSGDGITAFFQIAARGQSVVYVIDRSASMGLNGGLAAAKHELLTSLQQLPPAARFQVITYNRTANPLPVNGRAGLLTASAENKRQAALLIEALFAEGGTDHLPALKQALALQPDVIYFLTDADDFSLDQVQTVTLLNHGRMVIHTIVLTAGRPDPGERPLARLAQANRGEYRQLVISH